MSASGSQQPGAIEEVDVLEAARALDAGEGILVDVREIGEWQAGRAAPARHLPLSQMARRVAELPRDEPVYLICAVGGRSRIAAAMLRATGHDRPINVKGGTEAWHRAGLPMTR